jgi:hypothetical protein
MPLRKQPKPEPPNDPKTVVARVPNGLTANHVRRQRREVERMTELLQRTGADIVVNDSTRWY